MKQALREFSIPLKGLKQESYQFDFQIDKPFFDAFEDSAVKDGTIDATMWLEKKSGHLELYFEFEGTVKAECDRCLVEIDLPIFGEEKLIAKYSEETLEEEENIIYIHPEISHLEVAQYIYEYIALAVPIRKAYDCENDETPPCDTKMLALLISQENEAAETTDAEEQNEETDVKNPIWDSLKGFNKN